MNFTDGYIFECPSCYTQFNDKKYKTPCICSECWMEHHEKIECNYLGRGYELK